MALFNVLNICLENIHFKQNLRKQIKEKILEEHINEYEEGISKFFEEWTGLKLYVHDKSRGGFFLTSILHDKGMLLLISIYDGEKYFDKEYSESEVEILEKNKRERFIEEGYDIETYEKQYNDLIQEKESKSLETKDIWDREKLTLEYNRKIKELAKYLLDVNFDIVTERE